MNHMTPLVTHVSTSIGRQYPLRRRRLIHFLLLLAFLLLCSDVPQVACHTKGLHLRPHTTTNNNNTTTPPPRIAVLQQQFMQWVRFIGGRRHTSYRSALRNKLYPSITLTVDKNPLLGDFTSIQDAIDSLPPITFVRVLILINPGVYTEKVVISPGKAFLTVEGTAGDPQLTVVQWGDTAQTVGTNGKPLGTFNSATFAVNAPYFVAKNITFKNTTPVPPPGAQGMQGVAMRVSGDTAAFFGCRFLGAQDTLYDHAGRHYYKDCYIQGSVDFIFGNGLSFFEHCDLHAIAQNAGAVTAQNRMSSSEETGFSFVNCRVTGSGLLYLGRAWGNFSRVVFAYTYMDDIILPNGWHNWGDPGREQTVFYGQYKCTGPGATRSGRVPWSRELTDDEARPFLSMTFIDGSEWIDV